MSAVAPSARLAVVPPDSREVTLVPGFTATVKLAASETGGISIVEHTFDPGVLIPPHRHTREDEISCVISGRIGFRSDGREVALGAGGYIVKPRGALDVECRRPARAHDRDHQPGGIREVLHRAGGGDRGCRRPTRPVSHGANR